LREEDIKYFSAFLAEFQKEADRGSALVGAALIDTRLEAVVRSHFLEIKAVEELKGGNASRWTTRTLGQNRNLQKEAC